MSELGRFPLYFNIIKGMLSYCYRLENLGNNFPLLKDAYDESKMLHLSKKPSWYGSINLILKILRSDSGKDIGLLFNESPGKFKNNIHIILYLSHYLLLNGGNII